MAGASRGGRGTEAATAPTAAAARGAQRALAKRQAVYVDEVQRLLDAGLAMMRQRGTESSPRVAEIVAAAGLSNDAFYRHFASKEDLFAAIVDAGNERMVTYLQHVMEKHAEPAEQVRAWVAGLMHQAANAEIADATRAVVWNGGRVGDRSRSHESGRHRPFAELLVEPLTALGSADPERDADVMCEAAMGRMNEFLWQRKRPTAKDVAHLVAFCLGGVSASS